MKLTEYVSLLGTIVASLGAVIGALVTLIFSRKATRYAEEAEQHVRELEAERIKRLREKHVNDKTQNGAVDTAPPSPDD